MEESEMGRPVYPYELSDPDFSWLITTFRENNPSYILVEEGCLPIVLVTSGERQSHTAQISEDPEQFEQARFEDLLGDAAPEESDKAS